MEDKMRLPLVLVFLFFGGFSAGAAERRIGTWNIANLHHEDGVPLRAGAQPRDAEDYDRLKAFAATLNLDIAALQEAGSPRALTRIFPDTEYHLVVVKVGERTAKSPETRSFGPVTPASTRPTRSIRWWPQIAFAEYGGPEPLRF